MLSRDIRLLIFRRPDPEYPECRMIKRIHFCKTEITRYLSSATQSLGLMWCFETTNRAFPEAHDNDPATLSAVVVKIGLVSVTTARRFTTGCSVEPFEISCPETLSFCILRNCQVFSWLIFELLATVFSTEKIRSTIVMGC
jgi:hypothetical protein